MLNLADVEDQKVDFKLVDNFVDDVYSQKRLVSIAYCYPYQVF